MNSNVLRIISLLLFINIYYPVCDAQKLLEKKEGDIYHVNRWSSAGFVVGGNIANYFGQDRLRKKEDISLQTILALDRSKIWALDAIALKQGITGFEKKLEIADIGLIVAPLIPLTLGLDKTIRKDWLDVFLVYLEAQTLVANIYTWSPLGPTFIERLRPVVYFDEIPVEDRTFGGNRNSFFSGHVSTVTVGTMFTVQALMDAHPEMRKKAWLWYTVGALPGVYMGYLRVKGLKHFPSDVFTGFLVGAAGAILVPEFHKRKFNSKVSLFHNRIGTGFIWVHNF